MTAVVVRFSLTEPTTYQQAVLQIIWRQPERRVTYVPWQYRRQADSWRSLCGLFGRPREEHWKLWRALHWLEQQGLITIDRRRQHACRTIIFAAL